MYLNSSVKLFNAIKGPKDPLLNDGLTSFVKGTLPKKKKFKLFKNTENSVHHHSAIQLSKLQF